MKLAGAGLILGGVVLSGGGWAQTTRAPVLVDRTAVVYPPIARAAHVSGDVVVRFSIESDGTTSEVRVVSGPVMLQGAVADRIKEWRFKIPLPMGVEREFEAVYRFRLDAADETVDDDLDAAPYSPCCGDVVMASPDSIQVMGDVHSADGSQKIDVTPGPTKPSVDRCPEDKEKSVPAGSSGSDYVELFRAWTKGGRDYQVRVYRGGRVEWLGRDDVVVKGMEQASIRLDAAEALVAKFESPVFWSSCSKSAPQLEEDRGGEDFRTGTYLTAKIGDYVKTVDVYGSDGDALQRLMWAVDKTADTHRWIHGDAAKEPFQNMAEDIGMPKPGMTALIRSTYHFSHSSWNLTTDALKRLSGLPGADVDAVDESGWTALMYASELTQDDRETGMLLDLRANVNRTSLHGDTALMMAAYNGRLSERLLKSGADINVRNAEGVTVLMLLAQRTDVDELKAAIGAGADASAKDAQGRTALDYLRESSCNRAIVPLPEQWMVISDSKPQLCPANTEEYRQSEAVLKAAMRRAVR